MAAIFDFVQEALDFPRENCKLIHRGKMWRPDHDNISIGEAGLQAGSKLMLVATSAQDVSFVRASRPDPLVKGFAEEERDEINRRKRARAAAVSAWGTKQDAEHKFNSIKAEFKYSEPPPFEAEKLLQRLATDPGIIDIMKSKKFTVGILTEMSPLEAQERMAKRGTPNMDLLGYNQNAGEMIVLRLRTDNTKGFRPYHDLINTLIHELAHNVWGAHDHNFWQLYGELKAQYMRFHRFWSHGGKAADSGAVGQFRGFLSGDPEGGEELDAGGFGRALGGIAVGSPRSRAAEAAAARAAMGNGPGQEEPMVPNFLAGDGSWVIVCPCGQVHDPAGCQVAQAAANGQAATPAGVGRAAAPDAPGLQGPIDEPTPSAPSSASPLSEPVDAARPEGTATAGPNRPLSMEDFGMGSPSDVEMIEVDASPASLHPVGVEEHRGDEAAPAGWAAVPPEAPPAATPAVASAAQSLPSPWNCPRCTLENAPDAAACAACEALRPEANAAGIAAPDLDLADLEAQGLDGASLWLANFSQRLRTIRRLTAAHGASSSSARAAVETLLRLVCNVVDSPHEPKFRRIRAGNPKIRAALSSTEAEALMAMLGFEATSDASGERVFVLRDAAFDTARLRLGKELLERELEAVAVMTA